jgi:carboxymethylenebutenolidase
MSRPCIRKIRLLVVCLLLAPALWARPGKNVAYRSGDETVHGLLFTPSGKGPFPALLAIHAAFGLDDWTKGQASKLADSGYVVLAGCATLK